MQYFGYLRRNPDDAPDANFSGYNFWLSKLNQFGGDFVKAACNCNPQSSIEAVPKMRHLIVPSGTIENSPAIDRWVVTPHHQMKSRRDD